MQFMTVKYTSHISLNNDTQSNELCRLRFGHLNNNYPMSDKEVRWCGIKVKEVFHFKLEQLSLNRDKVLRSNQPLTLIHALSYIIRNCSLVCRDNPGCNRHVFQLTPVLFLLNCQCLFVILWSWFCLAKIYGDTEQCCALKWLANRVRELVQINYVVSK